MHRKTLFLFNISWRITLVYALLFSLVLFVLSTCLLYGIRFYFFYQGQEQVMAVEKSIENSIMTDPVKSQLTKLNDELLLNVPSTDNISVLILNSEHQIIVPQIPRAQQILEQKILANDHGHHENNNLENNSVQYREAHDRHLLYISKKLYTQHHEVIYLQVIKDFDNAYDFLTILFVMLLIFDFIGILLSLLIGHIVSRRILRPVDTITRTAESISAHDLSQRIEVTSPDDELSRLARTLNHMIARLETSFNQQNQFVSDASHELRTPVAVIKGYANMIDRWGKSDQAVLSEGIIAIKNETENMERLIQKLLFLAQGDRGELQFEIDDFSLDVLLVELVSESLLLTDKHQIELFVSEPVDVEADRELIKEAMRAVIDNSIKFTPSGGLIQVCLSKSLGEAAIQIKDSGIGIPKEDQPYILDRFYQADKSRTRKPGSSGLGLSIVKWIVEQHKGSLTVDSELGQGTVVTITLPLRRKYNCSGN